MSRDSVAEALREKLGELAERIDVFRLQRIYVDVPPEHTLAANHILYEQFNGRLATATGADERDRIEVLYHYCLDDEAMVVTIRTWARKPDVRLDSVATFYPAADWIEREIHDLLGVEFVDHPDPRRLLLSDDWPEGVYPLRREFPDRIEKPEDVGEPEPLRSVTK